jgi:hypothetical protein
MVPVPTVPQYSYHSPRLSYSSTLKTRQGVFRNVCINVHIITASVFICRAVLCCQYYKLITLNNIAQIFQKSGSNPKIPVSRRWREASPVLRGGKYLAPPYKMLSQRHLGNRDLCTPALNLGTSMPWRYRIQ